MSEASPEPPRVSPSSLSSPVIDVRHRASIVRPTGIAAGVTAAAEGYRDSEITIVYHHLAKSEERSLEPSKMSRFFVFDGRGDLEGHAVRSGDLAILPSYRNATLRASSVGLSCFVLSIATLNVTGYAVDVRSRVPLAPFDLDGTVVPAGTPFSFGDRANFTEVLVPPRVVTAEHELGVNERYLVFGGPATAFLDGVAHPLRAGDVVHIPSRTSRYVRNESREALRFYRVCTPSCTPGIYAAGRTRPSVPEGFDLARWWSRVEADYY